MTCTHCQAETADGMYLCDKCEGELFALLGRIPGTLTEAEVTIARLDSKRGTSRGQTSTVPVNLEAMQRATELSELLTSWSRMVYEVTGEPGDAGADYLRRQLRTIVGHEWAGDILNELDRAHRRLTSCIDCPPEVRTYGTCNEDGCTGTIRSVAGNEYATCRECGGRYLVRELTDYALDQAWGETASLAAVIRALNHAGVKVSHARARKWVERGKLRTPWVDERGRELYTMAQVIDVLKA